MLIIDTAGRLHTKTNLMEELRKVKRIIEKQLPGAPDETLLVLDATTGQNGLQQAKVFLDVADVSDVAVAKLDGTAKGGIVFAIARELEAPHPLRRHRREDHRLGRVRCAAVRACVVCVRVVSCQLSVPMDRQLTTDN